MHIIIVGCGKVGRTLAEQLQEEETDLTLIDMDADVINDLTEDIDAMGIVGNGASINTLMEAGVQTADILIAVTASDELNLLCCLIAQKTGHCQTIARVRNPIYSKEIGFIKERLGLSMIMNPELAAAREISRLLRFPAAIKIDPFSKGRDACGTIRTQDASTHRTITIITTKKISPPILQFLLTFFYDQFHSSNCFDLYY